VRPSNSFKAAASPPLKSNDRQRGISTVTVNIAIVLLNLGAALSAFIAAILWHRSATVLVPYKDEADANGIHSAAIIVGKNTDFIGTAIAQSLWSKRAAYAAAIAAALQGIALSLQSVAA